MSENRKRESEIEVDMVGGLLQAETDSKNSELEAPLETNNLSNNEIEKVNQDLEAEMASRDSEIQAFSVSKTSTKAELEKTSQDWLNFSTTSNSLFRGSSTASSRSPTLFGGFTGSSTTAASPIELVKE